MNRRRLRSRMRVSYRNDKGLAAKKFEALNRKDTPPLDANDLYGRIAASPERDVIVKAQAILKKYRFKPAKNRTQLAHKLSSVVQMYGKDALLDIAMIHPDRSLIAATVTTEELMEVGNADVIPAPEAKQPEYHNCGGGCTMAHDNGHKPQQKTKCSCSACNSNLPDTGKQYSDDGAPPKVDNTYIVLSAVLLGVGFGIIATMAIQPSPTKS